MTFFSFSCSGLGHLQLREKTPKTKMGIQSDLLRFSTLAQRLFRNWGPSIALYGGTLTAVGLYLTDWKVTNTNIPYYGNKFDDEGNL